MIIVICIELSQGKWFHCLLFITFFNLLIFCIYRNLTSSSWILLMSEMCPFYLMKILFLTDLVNFSSSKYFRYGGYCKSQVWFLRHSQCLWHYLPVYSENLEKTFLFSKIVNKCFYELVIKMVWDMMQQIFFNFNKVKDILNDLKFYENDSPLLPGDIKWWSRQC